MKTREEEREGNVEAKREADRIKRTEIQITWRRIGKRAGGGSSGYEEIYL